MKKAIFAGTFNPIHIGHKKIIEKALKLFDEVYLVIADNDFKVKKTEISKRYEATKKEISQDRVKVFMLEGKLLAAFAREHNIKFLIRSARNETDFKYELDMAKGNKELNNELETILIIPDYHDIKWSSTKLRKFVEENK